MMDAKDDTKMSVKKTQRNAVLIAGFTAFVLAVVKFIAGVFSGSVAVLSSAIDSMLDLLVSVLNFFAIRKSQASPNAKFNFGYTKVEALAALFEGIFIIGIALFILYESIIKIRANEVSINVDISILVMCFSLVVTGILVAFLNRVAKRTNNLIIKADALHYKSDLVTNLAVVAALLIIKFSGFVMIDAIFGIIISGYIAVSAVNLMKESVGVLLDKALDENVTDAIKEIILSKPQVAGFHGLTSRQSANICYLGVHLVFNREISLFDAHEISNEIEREIALKFSEFEWNFTTHLDPYDD
ncbi:cation diffusion facilitator family transporter [Campylobacter sp. RM9328]|uniref:cation diffusion facilitator family transporter n=1 Tax=Campylobacter sp. RM9328 TaxID=1705720 RepID=UPI0014745380|nr:cation diffusion facilitator family transporter [Campylobacter sp. RM9328]